VIAVRSSTTMRDRARGRLGLLIRMGGSIVCRRFLARLTLFRGLIGERARTRTPDA
jgi:hypothetical protein